MRWAALAGLAVLTACAPAAPPAPAPKTYDLYLLAGQSNMEGYGLAADLPRRLRGQVDGAYIYTLAAPADGEPLTESAAWRPLAPGFGTAYADGPAFGPELAFGRALAEAGRPVAIVKYARGGTGLVTGTSGYGSWDLADGPRPNQRDHALATLRAAMADRDVDGDGQPDRLVPAGIVWMQGEADAHDDAAAAAAYDANLAALMATFRQAIGRENLPVIIGRIVDSRRPNGEKVMSHAATVQAAQGAYADSDPCAALVTVLPAAATLADGWHYDADDQVALGEGFAAAATALRAACPPNPASSGEKGNIR